MVRGMLAEIIYLVTLRRMSATWKEITPAIREYAVTTPLPPGIALAQWYHEYEPLSSEEHVRIVATALLPIIEEQPDCLKAIHWVNDDFSRGTFSEYLESWHAQVPEQYRAFVRRIAREFGVEIGERLQTHQR